jgi:hypothetical protein
MDRIEWNLHTYCRVSCNKGERDTNLQIGSLKIGYEVPELSGLHKLHKLHKFELLN